MTARAHRGAADPALPAGDLAGAPRGAASTTRRCSAYALQAIRSFGILRGVVLAGWRLLRCNPWSHGGFDPVEQQRLFRHRAAPNP